MKPFKEFFAGAVKPSVHPGVVGKNLSIGSKGGWTDCTVTQITPAAEKDQYYLSVSTGGQVKVALTPTQVHSVTKGEEVKLTVDGADFWFGKQADGGKNKGSE